MGTVATGTVAFVAAFNAKRRSSTALPMLTTCWRRLLHGAFTWAASAKAGGTGSTSGHVVGERRVGSRAEAVCWLVGVLADDGDGGQHDERPGSTDPGLVDDEKWRQQYVGKMNGEMGP
ncbi:hypothetical protein ACLOJK_039287 [Asimina triloba]